MKFDLFSTVEEVKEWEKKALAPLIEENADRMKRAYVDCMDDSIVCGISDNLCKSRMSLIRETAKDYIEQVENGHLTYTFERVFLYDLEGNLVSEKIVNGAYGHCWIIGDGDNVKFVGCPKRESTLTKKGYASKTHKVTYKAVWNGDTKKYGTYINPVYMFECVERVLEDLDTEIDYVPCGHWVEVFYQNKQK